MLMASSEIWGAMAIAWLFLLKILEYKYSILALWLHCYVWGSVLQIYEMFATDWKKLVGKLYYKEDEKVMAKEKGN